MSSCRALFPAGKTWQHAPQVERNLIIMARHKTINAILHNFLGTFTSRHSDYNGYWLFGFLVAEGLPLTIDLLIPHPAGTIPTKVAGRIAETKFRERVIRHGMEIGRLERASIQIEKLPNPVSGQVNSHICAGSMVRCRAVAGLNNYPPHTCSQTMFVAPHNPRIQWRSTRDG